MEGFQTGLLGLVWHASLRPPFRLRVNDVIRIDGKIGRIIRVNECSAVVLLNQPKREFKTRFDKEVRFQPPPITVRISPNSEVEVLKVRKPKRKSR